MNRSQWFLLLTMVILFPAVITGCGTETQRKTSIQQVGFDLDDTLVYSTPAFQHAFKKDVEPFSKKFWTVVNSSDSEYSCVKPETLKLLKKHRRKNREIFIITAREPHGADVTREFVTSRFGVPGENVYFEPDGKTDRIKQLGIDLYYGDSDSDISDSLQAGARAVRIQRSPKSSYEKKYTPGKFNEKVLENTTGHQCQ